MGKLDHEFRKNGIELFLRADLERLISLNRLAKFSSSRMRLRTEGLRSGGANRRMTTQLIRPTGNRRDAA